MLRSNRDKLDDLLTVKGTTEQTVNDLKSKISRLLRERTALRTKLDHLEQLHQQPKQKPEELTISPRTHEKQQTRNRSLTQKNLRLKRQAASRAAELSSLKQQKLDLETKVALFFALVPSPDNFLT